MDDQTLELGLLLEAARGQQALAESAFTRLETHLQGLDDIVREGIRSTLVTELQDLAAQARSTERALRAVGRAANLRVALWSIGVTALCTAIPCCLLWGLIPSPSEMSALRARRDELAARVARLEGSGARLDLRRCGSGGRLCVRVDRQAPAYGESADYFVVKGY